MNARMAATAGALFGALAVILGAFGAHALRSHLEPRDLETFETAVRYQMYHAFALFAAAWLMSRNAPHATTAAWAFIRRHRDLLGLALPPRRDGSALAWRRHTDRRRGLYRGLAAARARRKQVA